MFKENKTKEKRKKVDKHLIFSWPLLYNPTICNMHETPCYKYCIDLTASCIAYMETIFI